MRVSDKQVNDLLAWIEAEQGLELNADRLRNMTAGQVRTELLQGIEQLFRPEMRQTERSVMLEFLDTAWKEHLYQMGLLKQGINFVGYAQKDPRTEYKREGRRTFLAMWERIAEQVTSTIFRIENESPHFVGSLWKITATEHDVAPPVESDVDQLETNSPEAGEEGRAVRPIVNAGPRVAEMMIALAAAERSTRSAAGSDHKAVATASFVAEFVRILSVRNTIWQRRRTSSTWRAAGVNRLVSGPG